MTAELAGRRVGCLCIGDITSGTSMTSGLSHYLDLSCVEARPFRCRDQASLWGGLQTALQDLRGGTDITAILARGTGCAGALALAEQLPVDRLALIDPAISPRIAGNGLWSRQARRLAAYARRNLSLCVSEALIVENGLGGVGRWLCDAGLAAHSRVMRLNTSGKFGKEMYTIRENAVKEAVSCFLHTGELPKPLAENSEMCIIYG